jgi:hypothetical protein
LVTCNGELVFIDCRSFRVFQKTIASSLQVPNINGWSIKPSTAMAGLQSYVLGNQPSQSTQPARTDRLLYATNAKVSARKSTIHPLSTPQPYPSTVYAPSYSPNPAAPRNTYNPTWYSADQHPASTTEKGIFDDTLSGIDETESVVFDGRQDVSSDGPGNNQFARTEDDYDEIETVIESIEPSSERPITPKGGGISGRFYQPPQSQQQHANMELRHRNDASTEQQLGSKKRNRFPESIDVVGKGDKSGQDKAVRPGNFDASSSGEESTSDVPNGGSNAGGLQNDRSFDYSDQQLERMTYKELKDDTWESEKHGRVSNLLQDLQDPARPLRERFENCIQLDGDKEGTQDTQVEFFAKMSTTEWEDAGDLFIERFTNIMTKLKEARQAKRKIATDFEKLIEEREAAIREKSEKLDHDLAEMRKGGEGVIRGKVI